MKTYLKKNWLPLAVLVVSLIGYAVTDPNEFESVPYAFNALFAVSYLLLTKFGF